MANVEARISLSVTDTRGGGGTFLVHLLVPDTTTLADVSTTIASLAALLETVSNAGIKLGEFSLINRTIAVAPGADSNVGAGAVFDFDNASNASIYGLFVPSILAALVDLNGNVDITTGTPAALVTALIGAVLGGTYTNTQYISNRAGTDAFSTNRKRNKRVRR